MGQPIISGIQSIGSVNCKYHYGILDKPSTLSVPKTLSVPTGITAITFLASGYIQLAGFRLDSEFLRATQLMPSSTTIPLLGGGAVSLTNNIRAGSFNLNCTRARLPTNMVAASSPNSGFEATDDGSGNDGTFYDFVFIAQCQQLKPGGDSIGSVIQFEFDMNGLNLNTQFNGCTIANVDPIALAGNDLPQYNITVNYTDWQATYSASVAN